MPDTVSLLGQVATRSGLYQTYDDWRRPQPGRCGADDYQMLQPKHVPLVVEHSDWKLGEVEYLERSDRTGLLGVAICSGPGAAAAADLLGDGDDWWLSPRFRSVARNSVEDTSAELVEVSVTRSPASLGTRPLAWSAVDLRSEAGGAPRMAPDWHETWTRAAGVLAAPSTRRASHVPILDLDRATVTAHVRAHPAPAPAAEPPAARRHTRADLARQADELGVAGYRVSVDVLGERRISHAGGRVVAFG